MMYNSFYVYENLKQYYLPNFYDQHLKKKMAPNKSNFDYIYCWDNFVLHARFTEHEVTTVIT